MVTDAQIGVAIEAFDQKAGYSKIEKMRAALEAALSAAEPQPAPSVVVKALQAIANYRHHSRLDSDENAEAMEQIARTALSAQVQDVAGWQPIETAPHDTNVLLAWTDSTLPCGWKMEAGMASWGWRRDGVSNMSEHGQATHWMPLPAAPARQEGGESNPVHEQSVDSGESGDE